MTILKRVMLFVIDIAFVLLALNALIIAFGLLGHPLVGGGHGHWTPAGLAVVFSLALHTFIWLLPLIVVMVIVSALFGHDHPTTDHS